VLIADAAKVKGLPASRPAGPCAGCSTFSPVAPRASSSRKAGAWRGDRVHRRRQRRPGRLAPGQGQRGNRNGWSLRELGNEGVLDAAAVQVRAGRRFWFVSLVPARDLDELSDQARRSDDVDVFGDSLSKELEAKFAVLAGRWGGRSRLSRSCNRSSSSGHRATCAATNSSSWWRRSRAVMRPRTTLDARSDLRVGGLPHREPSGQVAKSKP